MIAADESGEFGLLPRSAEIRGCKVSLVLRLFPRSLKWSKLFDFFVPRDEIVLAQVFPD